MENLSGTRANLQLREVVLTNQMFGPQLEKFSIQDNSKHHNKEEKLERHRHLYEPLALESRYAIRCLAFSSR